MEEAKQRGGTGSRLFRIREGKVPARSFLAYERRLKGVVRGAREGSWMGSPPPPPVFGEQTCGIIKPTSTRGGDVSSLIGSDVMGIPGRSQVYEG